MTKYGFYSIVQKQGGEFHVRSRELRDLENLVERVPLPGAEIISSESADYAFRVIVDRDSVLAILAFLGTTLDYDNFKACVGRTPDQSHKPYHKVWQVLADALGAYGEPGRIRGKDRE